MLAAMIAIKLSAGPAYTRESSGAVAPGPGEGVLDPSFEITPTLTMCVIREIYFSRRATGVVCFHPWMPRLGRS